MTTEQKNGKTTSLKPGDTVAERGVSEIEFMTVREVLEDGTIIAANGDKPYREFKEEQLELLEESEEVPAQEFEDDPNLRRLYPEAEKKPEAGDTVCLSDKPEVVLGVVVKVDADIYSATVDCGDDGMRVFGFDEIIVIAVPENGLAAKEADASMGKPIELPPLKTATEYGLPRELPPVAMFLLLGEWARANAFPGAMHLPRERYDAQGNRWHIRTTEDDLELTDAGAMVSKPTAAIVLVKDSKAMQAVGEQADLDKNEHALAALQRHKRDVEAALNAVPVNDQERRQMFTKALQEDQMKVAALEKLIIRSRKFVDSQASEIFRFKPGLIDAHLFVSGAI